MATLRESILAADDLPRREVPTPEWAKFGAKSVWVRGLTAAERDDYEQSLTERAEDGGVRAKVVQHNIRAAFVARVIVDAQGVRVFTDKDIEALGNKSAAVIDRLWDVGRELSGMGLPEENPSTGDQVEHSSSDSPLRSV
jgi:hypothetical protein